MRRWHYLPDLSGTRHHLPGTLHHLPGALHHLPSALQHLPGALQHLRDALQHLSGNTCCQPTLTIAQILCQDCNATQFVAALQQAGLMDCLNGAGPFTVFAPTNCAFSRLDCCTRNAWACDPQALKNVLLYHIAYGKLMGRDIARLNSLGTLQGSPVLSVGAMQRYEDYRE